MENFGTAWNRLERFGISWKWIFDTIFDTAHKIFDTASSSLCTTKRVRSSKVSRNPLQNHQKSHLTALKKVKL
jgi:hypothetical protein